MVSWEIVQRLCSCFNKSFINGKGEFIAQLKGNQYFILCTCETELDVKSKVLEWLSAGAYKTQPYKSKKKNDEFHTFMLNGINQFLGTEFNETDIEQIYTYLGNACNHKKTVAFIESGYCMDVLMNHKTANTEKTVTTQQVLELCKAADDVCQDTKDIIREALVLKIAEEQGLLFTLPFKIGQQVWIVGNDFISNYVIKQFIVTEQGVEAIHISKEISGNEYWNTFYMEQWLVNVFPTEQEAKQMKENKYGES